MLIQSVFNETDVHRESKLHGAKTNTSWYTITISIYNNNCARVILEVPTDETVVYVPSLRFNEENKGVLHVVATQKMITEYSHVRDNRVVIKFYLFQKEKRKGKILIKP